MKNNIFDIYEAMYHGILDTDIDSRLNTADNDVKDIMNSRLERFVRIISLATHLNDNESDILRTTITDMSKKLNMDRFICHITIPVRDSIIKASDRKIDVREFDGLITGNKAEYNFSIGIDYMVITRADDRATNTKVLNGLPKDKWVKYNNGLECMRLGNNLILYKKDELLYFYTEQFRLSFRLTDKGYTSFIKPLYD